MQKATNSAAAEAQGRGEQPERKRVALFASVDSFEAFYGGTFGLNRTSFLQSYRNDFIWEYTEGLRSLGHEVFIYMRSYGPPALERVESGLHVRFLHVPLWVRPLDALLFRGRSLARVPAWRERVSYAGYGTQLKRALREDRIEVLYHQEIWTPRFDLIVKHSPIPVVGADHGALYADWMEASKRRALTASAGATCQSQAGLERIQSFGGRGLLLRNGVDEVFFHPPETPQARPKMVLAVGRFVEQQKRFADLLQAMQTLPDFRLLLVGSGPDEARLKELAKTLQVSERVEFTGFVKDRERLRRLYQQCGVFACSSSWEAVALVVLEAMSCAAPVVATRIPSFLELLEDGHNGLLVPVGEPQALAAGIRRAYQMGAALGEHARTTVTQRYSASAVYQQLSDVIQAA